MSLRTKTLLILASSLLLASIVLVGSLRIILNRQFAALEEGKVQENVRRVELALENMTTQLSSKATDWAQWDDTYAFMHDRNEEYIHSNISFETLSAISVTHVVYRDIKSALVRGYEVNYADKKVGDLSPAALEILAKGAAAMAGTTPEAIKSGLILVKGRPYIFAAIPIFDSRRAETCRGSLLFSIELNDDLTAALAEQTRLNVRLLPSTVFKEEASFLSKLADSQHPVTAVISNEEIRGYKLLSDTSDNVVRIIEVTLNRDIFQQGQEVLKLLLSALLVVMIVTLFVSAFSLNLWVLARLQRLKHEVSSIDTSCLTGVRVQASGKDELASLGGTINSFLATLEENHRLLIVAQRVADAANAAKSMFIARVSHELRTPIAGIIGINSMIMKREGSKAVRELLKMGDLAAEGLLSIINEILDFTKIEAGELTFENIAFDTRQMLRETMQVVAARLEGKYKPEDKKRLELICEVDPMVPVQLIGDPTKLKQILINLLGNSVKFTHEGHVALKIYVEPSQFPNVTLMLEVRDTGIGIPPNQVEFLFNPFKQADASIARQYQGSGLGLSIVKQFCEGMGGSVTVSSIQGKGSTFTVKLPLKVNDSSDYLLVSQKVKAELPNNTILLATGSDAISSLTKSLRSFGVKSTLLEPHESQALSASTLLAPQLLVVSEQALEVSKIYESIKQRVGKGVGCTVAMLGPSNLELREKLYADGFKYVLQTPALADDLLLAYLNKLPQINERASENTTALKFKQPLKILIADDIPTNRIILEEMLCEAGHNVTAVYDGKQMLDLLKPMIMKEANAEHFDIVLTDVSMPVMDGDVATRAIRELEVKTGVHIPIIAVTAHALIEEQKRIRDAGVDGVLTKPLHPEKVAAEFERLLSIAQDRTKPN